MKGITAQALEHFVQLFVSKRLYSGLIYILHNLPNILEIWFVPAEMNYHDNVGEFVADSIGCEFYSTNFRDIPVTIKRRDAKESQGFFKKRKARKRMFLEDALHGRFDISEQEEHRCEQLIIIELTVMGYRDDWIEWHPNQCNYQHLFFSYHDSSKPLVWIEPIVQRSPDKRVCGAFTKMFYMRRNKMVLFCQEIKGFNVLMYFHHRRPSIIHKKSLNTRKITLVCDSFWHEWYSWNNKKIV